ncbi:glycosyl hydrolase, family 31 [Onchocerca flexuosa]|uniref:Glycosyl hydrolase, family 31 n=1 Tax=Onchocerca flexuosa TaxID=387005 RepID=A0A238BPP0_9BILA|nr:glycosyl hydrolase, family 31 [Onchocerca flexuosa]
MWDVVSKFMTLRIILIFFIYVSIIQAVDRSNFKKCEQSGFCKRHRTQTEKANYIVTAGTVTHNSSTLTADLVSRVNKLKLSIVSLNDATIRLLIDEKEGAIRPRFQPLDALKDGSNLKTLDFKSVEINDNSTIIITANNAKVLLNYEPFRIDLFIKDELVISINPNNALKFEQFRKKEDGDEAKGAEGFWEEDFKNHHDSKPFGSSSVGIDLSFIGYKFIYGLPEHADSFALRSTTSVDPYRLYNLDVFEFEVNELMSLYGAVPFLLAHNKEHSLGLLWLNAAETWVDIDSSTADKACFILGILRSLVEKFRRNSVDVPQIDVHFMSESGLVDFFLMLGPKPDDIFRQNSGLTGVYPLPPLFALGYHQCRWNYNDEVDVLEVHANFDKHDIPVDAIWLDIEHTDGKRYFTWDPNKFSKPKEMIDSLVAKGRKMITIIDPHIKKDSNYHVYKEAKELGYFIKKRDGEEYEGHCWPGASAYLDFLNPAVRNFWANKFAFDQYAGSTQDLFTWNDMNEPSVFSGPEVTMDKDARHFGDWEHRDIHNIYGFYHHSSTYRGHLARTNGHKRPFILTRSFFAGSQRTTAVWTGDNTASWQQLKITVPMLLSLSISGIPHVGADVGGFFGNPDEQLLIRWYQVAAFQPFFRSHSHIDTKRREPWLFSDSTKLVIRKAIRTRYSLLPYWYTLFYEHTLTGKPPMRPLWSEFPDDEDAFDEEREWLIGPSLLVRPVMDPDVQSVSLYLPGKRNVIWYGWNDHKGHGAPGAVYVDTPIDVIPLFQRGGTIIPTWERVRRASSLMIQDPITLYIAINFNGDHANGTIYMDDGETFEYRNGQYFYWGFIYKKEGDQLHSISSKNLDKRGKLESDAIIEKIVIRGVRYYPTNVHIYLDDWNPETADYIHDRDAQTLIIRKPNVLLTQEFRIDIHI